jgi:two-component system NtrC family response regulator
VITATNRPLPDLIRKGEFREDLFYRLNVVPITLPPLRDRVSDIPLLVTHFARKYGGGRKIVFSDEAIRLLQDYEWPGNVREIENFCERIILMTDGDEIGLNAVRGQIELMVKEQRDIALPRRMTLPELERRAVTDALVTCEWNQSRAARLLGIPRHVLLYRMKKFDIARPDRKPGR